MYQGWLMKWLAVLSLSVTSQKLSAQEEYMSKGILDRIAESAKQQVDSAIKSIDSAVVMNADAAIGTAAASLGGATQAIIGTAGTVAAEAITGANKGVAGLFSRGHQKRLEEQLSRGRVILSDLRFVGFTPELEAASEQPLEALAQALKGSMGVFLIESHTDRSENPAADQRLSEVRASLVKAKLVAAGVPADRLVSAGFGSLYALAGGAKDASRGSARIEVARMQ